MADSNIRDRSRDQLVTLAAIDATDDHPDKHIPGTKETYYGMEEMVGAITVEE